MKNISKTLPPFKNGFNTWSIIESLKFYNHQPKEAGRRTSSSKWSPSHLIKYHISIVLEEIRSSCKQSSSRRYPQLSSSSWKHLQLSNIIKKESSWRYHHQRRYLHLKSKYFILYVSIYKPNDFILQGKQKIGWRLELPCMEEYNLFNSHGELSIEYVKGSITKPWQKKSQALSRYMKG